MKQSTVWCLFLLSYFLITQVAYGFDDHFLLPYEVGEVSGIMQKHVDRYGDTLGLTKRHYLENGQISSITVANGEGNVVVSSGFVKDQSGRVDWTVWDYGWSERSAFVGWGLWSEPLHERTDNQKMIYNEAGHLAKTLSYDGSGDLFRTILNRWNTDNQLVQSICAEDGIIVYNAVIEYLNGKPIMMLVDTPLVNVVSTFNDRGLISKEALYGVTLGSGILSETMTYMDDGTFSSAAKNVYGAKGTLLQSTTQTDVIMHNELEAKRVFLSRGLTKDNLMAGLSHTYEYNEKGLWTIRKTHDVTTGGLVSVTFRYYEYFSNRGVFE